MRDHPAHVRVLVDGLVRDPEVGAQPSRWQSVSGILEQGQAAGAFRPFDARTMAVMINGALDGVVDEWVGAPDLDAAAAELGTAVLLAVRRTRAG